MGEGAARRGLCRKAKLEEYLDGVEGDDYYLAKAFQALDSTFSPPDHYTIAGTLLDRCYTKVKAKVDEVLSSIRHLNLTFDESTNIR